MCDTANSILEERIALTRERLREIPQEQTAAEPFRDYFRKTAEFLLSVNKDAGNYSLYEDILPGNYDHSYANPDYATRVLGKEFGPVLSAIYAELRGIIAHVFEGNEESAQILIELFMVLYSEFSDGDIPKLTTVVEIFRSYICDYLPDYQAERIRQQVVPGDQFAVKLIEGEDLMDTDYLYKYGEYISESTLELTRHMISLPEETIRRMAETYTEGFRKGFENARKPLHKKKTVQLVYELGFERVIKEAIGNFRAMGLEPTILRYPVQLVLKPANRHNGYTGAVPNLQFDYDHREDLALFMNEEFASLRKRALREAYEEVRDMASKYAGPAVIETFGRDAFVPAMHKNVILMNEAGRNIHLALKNSLTEITCRYIPGDESSFTIIAFPVPEIGGDFKQIFDETIEVNTLDSDRYLKIQQKLIDALDKGWGAHVQGMNGNETDLTVRFHELAEPASETNFENCVADVNIPVGEVFTSPVLYGTSGILHVKRVFLEGYEFLDLKISLKDGFIEEYSCGNFESEEENRKYIEDNILFHHPTLPIGEFAIGTNTRAYTMGRRYGIEARLPILIAEKTGPHFAMGDTCYSWEEDNPVYNPDGKEIIARDNERSLLRKSDVSKAYFGCHTDITIPYDELGELCVLHEDGSAVPIIKNGRFVLPGTEELNEALGKNS